MLAARGLSEAKEAFADDFYIEVAHAGAVEQRKIQRELKGKFPTYSAGDWRDWDRFVNDARDKLHARTIHTLTDDGNASRLIEEHGQNLAYCPAFRSWLVWDGARWQQDATGKAQELAVETMRKFLGESIGQESRTKFANQSLSAKHIWAMLELAKSRRVVTPDQLDTSPWLLNFKNGTVDLRTGTLHPHKREDWITKLVAHSYRPGAQCNGWRRFLDWAMGGGADASDMALDRAARFVAYIQTALGYSITGATSEKAVFILWGPGGNNGKTTMLDVVRQLIPEYSGHIAVETLMTRRYESSNASADIAMLRGVRFVQTTEAEESQALAQGQLKMLTAGRGEIHACRKYENPISFPASHKIWLDTNERPRILNPDDKATMARLHLIEFPASLREDELDRELPNRLVKEESEGILAWLVEGARLWSNGSLVKPREVVAARDEWRDAMDVDHPWARPIADWIDEEENKWAGTLSSFSFSIEQLLTDAVKRNVRDQTKGDKIMVGTILSKMGSFERFRGPRANRGGRGDWLYKRVEKN